MTDHAESSSPLPLGLRPSDLWTAAATGALTLPDPARRTPLTRFALRSAIAATAAVGMWSSFQQEPELRYDVPRQVAFTVGTVGLVYGVAELGEAMDRALQRRLVRMGVRRPRLAMAVAGVALSLVTSAAERRTAGGEQDEQAGGEPTYRELPAAVRELVAGILEQTEDHDSLRLRAQLAVAREEVWGEESDPPRLVELSVPDDVPLAVPHHFTFPVSAHFVSARGVPCRVLLGVSGGKLATVLVDLAGDAAEDAAPQWYPGSEDPDPLAGVDLPLPADVTFVTEQGR